MRLLFLLTCFLALSAYSQTREEVLTELNILYNNGDFEKAVPLAKKAIEITRKELGTEDIQYARSLNDLGAIYYALGQFEQATPLMLQAAELRKKILGEDAPLYVETLEGVALNYAGLGDYENALKYYQQVSLLWKRIEGNFSEKYGRSLQQIGTAYGDLGDYENSKKYFVASIEIQEKVFGKRSAEYAAIHYSIAYLEYIYGYYEETIKRANYSAAIRKDLEGPASSAYATCMALVGMSYINMGQYDIAEPILLEVSAIEDNIGDENGQATAKGNLAVLYLYIGHYTKAEALLKKVVAIKERTVGKESNEYLTALGNLSVAYTHMEEYEKAEPLMKELVLMRKNILDKNHPDLALSIHNLGQLYQLQEKYKESEAALTEAMMIRKQMLGEDHPDFAFSLEGLAALYFATEEYNKIEPLLLTIESIRKKSLGEKHQDYASSLNNLAVFYSTVNQYDKAEKAMMRSNSITRENITSSFSLLSEKEKEQFLVNRITVLDDNNSLIYNHTATSKQFIKHSYAQLLFFKSLLLSDSRNMIKMVQASADEKVKSNFKQWSDLRKQLAEEYALPLKERDKELSKIEDKTEALEKLLMQQSAAFRRQHSTLSVEMRDIQKALFSDEAAIEFVRFDLFNKQWTDSTMYAAYILRKHDSIPLFVPLCEEAQLQKIFDSAGRFTQRMVSELYQGEKDGKRVSGALGAHLYQLIWAPLEPYLKDIKRVSYSPAGKLYKVAFNALPVNSTELLMDKYELRQYTSTKEIAHDRDPVAASPKTDVALFGDPVFTLDSLQLVKQRPAVTELVSTANLIASLDRSERGGVWLPLPGTAEEIKKIGQLFSDNSTPTTTYTQLAASEAALKALSGNSPRWLHIATHGFFLPIRTDQKKGKAMSVNNTYALADDPLLRSGLVLSGGNYAWSGKTPIPGVEDGIVTAYEISQMDLAGTEMAVLSACETALGDVKGSEGVFGLQRAFKMAGVQKMIVSLWKVPDLQTAELMNLFYDYRLKGKKIEEAFSQAQAEMRKKYSAYYWAAFMLIQ